MADMLAVDTDILQHDIGELEEHLNRVNDRLKGMFKQVEELNTLWKGQANEAFSAQFRADYETMQSMVKDLQKYKESLQKAKNKYDGCESYVMDMVSSLRI